MKRLAKHKLLLAVLCVIIGVAPIVAYVNTLESGRHMLHTELKTDDSLLLDIPMQDNTIEYSTLTSLSKEIPEISAIIPISAGSTMVSSYRAEGAASLKAVGSSFWKYAGLKLTKGKFFSNSHLENKSKVVVVDELMADKLFGTTAVIGRKVTLSINGSTYEAVIVGVCKSLDNSEKSLNKSQGLVYVPVTMLDNETQQFAIQRLLIVVKDMQIVEAKAKAVQYFKAQGIKLSTDNISEIDQIVLLQAFAENYRVILLVLGVLWFAAAVVGLTSLLMLDIEQSKKLYGLLRFYGCNAWSIKSRILLKSYFSAITSGGLSTITGLAISFAICTALNIPIYLSIHSLTLGIVLPLILFLSASIYPAHKAAAINVNSIIWQLE